MELKNVVFSLSAVGVSLLVGCASDTVGKMSLDESIRAGDRGSALANLRTQEKKVPQRDRLQFLLQKGQMEWALGELDAALASFAEARVLIDLFDEAAQVSLSGSAGDYLVQPGLRPYAPKIADRLHLHHYSALCYLEMGDYDAFRVEMRAIQDANDRVANLNRLAIEREEALLAQAQEERNVGPVEQLPDFVSDARIAGFYSSIQSLDPVTQARARYESPMLHFFEGIVQAHMECLGAGDGDDAERARVALRMASEMVPDSITVSNALALALRDGDRPVAHDRVWILHENGLAPKLGSVKVAVAFSVPSDQRGAQDLSLMTMGADVVIPVPVSNPLFGQALFTFPTIEQQDPALFYPELLISADEGVLGRTHRISSPEEQQMLNFKADLPRAIRVAVVGGMIKAAVEQVATKEGGLGGFIASRVFTQATSGADTRAWTTLPREFQVACLDRPQSGMVTIGADRGVLQYRPLNIQLAPEGMATIVYVSTPTYSAEPLVRVFAVGNNLGQPYIQRVPQFETLPALTSTLQ